MTGTKPPLDVFVRALLYDTERQRLGIALDAFEARSLLVDDVAMTAYYASWSPDFRTVALRARPKLTAAQRARAAVVLAGSAAVAIAVIAAGVLAALLAFAMITSASS